MTGQGGGEEEGVVPAGQSVGRPGLAWPWKAESEPTRGLPGFFQHRPASYSSYLGVEGLLDVQPSGIFSCRVLTEARVKEGRRRMKITRADRTGTAASAVTSCAARFIIPRRVDSGNSAWGLGHLSAHTAGRCVWHYWPVAGGRAGQ